MSDNFNHMKAVYDRKAAREAEDGYGEDADMLAVYSNEEMLCLTTEDGRPFAPLDQATREEAIAAVKEAMETYVPPGPLTRARDAAWLWLYRLKLSFALAVLPLYVYVSGKDPRLASQKLWRVLGL